MDKQAIAMEALNNARSSSSLLNYPTIFTEFATKGIPQADIKPRENVLTYHAWRALGRQVRKGEHGVQVITWVPMTKKTGEQDATTGEEKREAFRRPRNATVFHVSQTDPIN